MYIQSVCSISALPIIRSNESLPDLIVNAGLELIEPAYNDYIPPMQSRRMSKGLKMGLAAALDCIQQINYDASMLQAIEIGTAYGLLKDSETFLGNMITQEETALNPTPFIQSTHNTVSGAIALSLKAHVHNMTFTHKGHSFEHAMLDAELSLNNANDKMVLLGAVDERIAILENLVGTNNAKMGIGQAASFFLLSNQSTNAIAKISTYKTFKTNNNDQAAEHLKTITTHHDCTTGQCPKIVWNSAQLQHINYTSKILDVSKIIGYNPTGSALALAIGAKYCQEQGCPIVVVNQFKDYWSVFELSSAKNK